MNHSSSFGYSLSIIINYLIKNKIIYIYEFYVNIKIGIYYNLLTNLNNIQIYLYS